MIEYTSTNPLMLEIIVVTLTTNFVRVAFTPRVVRTLSHLSKCAYIDTELQGGLVKSFPSIFVFDFPTSSASPSPIATSGL